VALGQVRSCRSQGCDRPDQGYEGAHGAGGGLTGGVSGAGGLNQRRASGAGRTGEKERGGGIEDCGDGRGTLGEGLGSGRISIKSGGRSGGENVITQEKKVMVFAFDRRKRESEC